MTFKPAKWPRKLRSAEWYSGSTKDVIYHRGWMKNQGYPDDLFDGRPIIGILNTWSDLTPQITHKGVGGVTNDPRTKGVVKVEKHFELPHPLPLS